MPRHRAQWLGMNPKWKLTAYAVLVILCAWFGRCFYVNYSTVTNAATADIGEKVPAATADASTNASTNNPANTNAATTVPTVTDTNAPATQDANAPAASDTNLAATPDTNVPVTTSNAPPPLTIAAQKPAPPVNLSSVRGAMIAYLAALVGAVIGLGLLIAYDATQYMGSRAVDYFFGDTADAIRDPEYERAEAEWANGKYLDAIQLMRDFLQKNPREIHAALRIAEIYEKDLKNPLAAALEYQEVLKHKLPAERWGWAAIHLCNLYSRLNKSDEALALLRRVVEEYPKTAAAKKARARLGVAEPKLEATEQEIKAEVEPDSTEETHVITMEEHPPELEPRTGSSRPPPRPKSPEAPPPPEPSKPSLPPGFRPKK
jgi:TolA-binding protein